MPGILEERVELLMRSLPKWQRQACFPIGEALADFLALWEGWEPRCELTVALAEFLTERSGHAIEGSCFNPERLPPQLRPRLRVYGDGGEELSLGEDVHGIRDRLAGVLRERREEGCQSRMGNDRGRGMEFRGGADAGRILHTGCGQWSDLSRAGG